MPSGISATPAATTNIQRRARRDRTPQKWSWPRFGRNATLLAAVIAASAWYVAAGVVPNLVPKRFGTVVEGHVYRSGELTPAATRDVVNAHNIKTIIDFGAHTPDSPADRRAQSTAEALGVHRVVLPLYGDATGDPNRYVEALRILRDPAYHPVLVHCSAGSQRTGCAVALFRTLDQGWSREAALAEAANYDHDPADNPKLGRMLDLYTDAIDDALRTGATISYHPADQHIIGTSAE